MICHKLRIIFIHIPRTAGTSVELALTGENWWHRGEQVCNGGVQHRTSAQARRAYGEHWDEYFKFSTVRNPFTRAVSAYKWRFKRTDTEGFREWILSGMNCCLFPGIEESESFPQSYHLTEPMDRILRFERIASDFTEFCNDRSIEATLPTIHETRPEENIKDWYDIETAAWMAKHFHEDFSRFGYRPEL